MLSLVDFQSATTETWRGGEGATAPPALRSETRAASGDSGDSGDTGEYFSLQK